MSRLTAEKPNHVLLAMIHACTGPNKSCMAWHKLIPWMQDAWPDRFDEEGPSSCDEFTKLSADLEGMGFIKVRTGSNGGYISVELTAAGLFQAQMLALPEEVQTLEPTKA